MAAGAKATIDAAPRMRASMSFAANRLQNPAYSPKVAGGAP
jgi:hypothetical protein